MSLGLCVPTTALFANMLLEDARSLLGVKPWHWPRPVIATQCLLWIIKRIGGLFNLRFILSSTEAWDGEINYWVTKSELTILPLQIINWSFATSPLWSPRNAWENSLNYSSIWKWRLEGHSFVIQFMMSCWQWLTEQSVTTYSLVKRTIWWSTLPSAT